MAFAPVSDGSTSSASESRRLKVCLASQAPFVGGADVAAERLALGLQRAGHDVFLVLGTRGAVMERMEQAGLRSIPSPIRLTDKWRFWQYVSARRALCRILEREKPSVVHSNDLPTHQMVSDAARRVGLPRICHHRYFYSGQAIDWLNKQGAERHLFVSHALMEELCQRSPRLASSARVVVHDGLELPNLPGPDERRRLRGNLGLSHDRTIILFAGQIIERKGVADLLRAWSLLRPRYGERAELVLVGDDLETGGRYRAQMESLAAELDCEPGGRAAKGRSPRWAGFQREVGPWLAASDIAVVPSLVEPLGNATLEAMAYALPVVGCKVGGIPEMIVHGETGLLVEPARPNELAGALARLLDDAALRRAYGEAGRRRCADLFGLGVHVANVIREYRSVLPLHC